jgi:hypothetical protein
MNTGQLPPPPDQQDFRVRARRARWVVIGVIVLAAIVYAIWVGGSEAPTTTAANPTTPPSPTPITTYSYSPPPTAQEKTCSLLYKAQVYKPGSAGWKRAVRDAYVASPVAWADDIQGAYDGSFYPKLGTTLLRQTIAKHC